jgi:hypothetical protein
VLTPMVGVVEQRFASFKDFPVRQFGLSAQFGETIEGIQSQLLKMQYADWAGVITWPTRLEARVIDEPLHMVDIMPTAIALAGAPANPADKPLDGKDIWATVAAGQVSPHDDILVNLEAFRSSVIWTPTAPRRRRPRVKRQVPRPRGLTRARRKRQRNDGRHRSPLSPWSPLEVTLNDRSVAQRAGRAEWSSMRKGEIPREGMPLIDKLQGQIAAFKLATPGQQITLAETTRRFYVSVRRTTVLPVRPGSRRLEHPRSGCEARGRSCWPRANLRGRGVGWGLAPEDRH